jgi:hypothetical protein
MALGDLAGQILEEKTAAGGACNKTVIKYKAFDASFLTAKV